LLKGQRDEDELDVMEEIARDPSIISREWLNENRGRMTRTTFTKLLGDLNDPPKMQEASVDADLVNATLVRNGLNDLAFPKLDPDKRASLLFRDNVTQAISYEQMLTGRKLSREEKQAVIDNLLLDRAFSNQDGAKTVIAAMTPEQQSKAYTEIVDRIPDKERQQIRAALEATNQRVNASNMAMMYLQYERMKKAE